MTCQTQQEHNKEKMEYHLHLTNYKLNKTSYELSKAKSTLNTMNLKLTVADTGGLQWFPRKPPFEIDIL